MSTNSTELELFHTFVTQQLAAGRTSGSLDNAIEEFRRYQREQSALKANLRVAESESERGESGPFDAAATKQHFRDRLSNHGATG
jgi:hypothetical protein